MEVRLALIFPLLIKSITTFGWKINLGLGLLASFLYYLYAQTGGEISQIPLDYWYTFSLLPMFITGSVLAKYKDRLISVLSAQSKTVKIALLTISLILYTSRYWLFFQEGVYSSHTFLSDVAIVLGTALLIVLAISTSFSTMLRFGPLLYLGTRSYSIYLLHSVVLLFAVHMMYGKLPLFIILPISVGITFILAELSYRFLEKPAIKWGKMTLSYFSNSPQRDFFWRGNSNL